MKDSIPCGMEYKTVPNTLALPTEQMFGLYLSAASTQFTKDDKQCQMLEADTIVKLIRQDFTINSALLQFVKGVCLITLLGGLSFPKLFVSA